MNSRLARLRLAVTMLVTLALAGCGPVTGEVTPAPTTHAPTATVPATIAPTLSTLTEVAQYELTVAASTPTPSTGVEYCTNWKTGTRMSYEEAMEIARGSECVEEGQLKETHMCNEFTGTWWLDLGIEKPGCNPACVIQVVDKAAEINWRCTGIISEGTMEVSPTDQPTEVPTAVPPTATVIPLTPIPPATPSQGWQLYINDVYGYQFSYPASAVVTEIGVQGFPTDELPEGMSPDQYIAQLQEKYGDKLCVSVSYKLGYVNISAPSNEGFRYAGCGRTGVGAGDIVEKSEAVMSAGEIYTAKGFEFIGTWDPCETLNCHNETFVVILPDRTRIEYGAAPSESATYKDYLETTKNVLLQILASYERVD